MFGFHGLEVTTKLRVSWVRGEKKVRVRFRVRVRVRGG